MNNVIQGIFGDPSNSHLIRQAAEIPHNPGDVLCTNGRAVMWVAKRPVGWSPFAGNVIRLPQSEPPCAA